MFAVVTGNLHCRIVHCPQKRTLFRTSISTLSLEPTNRPKVARNISVAQKSLELRRETMGKGAVASCGKMIVNPIIKGRRVGRIAQTRE
jgi:hypothetical protein